MCSTTPRRERTHGTYSKLPLGREVRRQCGGQRSFERSFTVPDTDRLVCLVVLFLVAVHTQYFGHQMMNAGIPFRWQSSDPDPQALASQQAYMDDAPSLLRAHLLHPLPLTLDSTGIVEVATTMVLKDGPPLDLIVCINMIHIAPWSATKGLMRLAGQRLRSGGDGHNVGGVLYLYGPYRVKGACVTSNE